MQVSDPLLQGRVALRVMGMDGHIIAGTSINDARGSVEFTFGKEVPNGIYVVRFQSSGGAGSARVLLQR